MGVNIIKPLEETSKKVGSKEIIASFLQSGVESGEIDIPSTNRSVNNVYTSLLTYVQRHPDVGVEVRLVDGRIVLYRISE